MRLIPDDPIVSSVLRTGYPPWMQQSRDDYDDYEEEPEPDVDDEEEEREP